MSISAVITGSQSAQLLLAKRINNALKTIGNPTKSESHLSTIETRDGPGSNSSGLTSLEGPDMIEILLIIYLIRLYYSRVIYRREKLYGVFGTC